MKKGKEPAEYTSDDEPTTDHSEEEVELNNGEMMNTPEEKAISDAIKLAESLAAERSQTCRDSRRRAREKKVMFITSLQQERLERYIQSSVEHRRLQQERIDLEILQQEQSRAPNAAQDPNSMLEPRQIQTSGPLHQLGGSHNAAHHSYGMLDTDAVISDWINDICIPGSADSTTREELEKLSGVDDFDQDVPAPQQSGDNSVLGSEMPSTAQLQEGMSTTNVEKVTSDAGQQIE